MLQVQDFILGNLNNCAGFLIVLHVHAVTVLLEYLTDCSIRISRFLYGFFFGEGGTVPPSGSTTDYGMYLYHILLLFTYHIE